MVISRIIDILLKLKKFVSENTSPPDTKSYNTVKEALRNPLFPVILEFSRSLAMDLEPFLKIFQVDRPLSVFLYEKLKEIFKDLLQRIVKPEILEAILTAAKLLSLDLNNEANLLSPVSVNVGFGAQSLIKKSPIVNWKNFMIFKKLLAFLLKSPTL